MPIYPQSAGSVIFSEVVVDNITITSGQIKYTPSGGSEQTYQLPDVGGTFALTSDKIAKRIFQGFTVTEYDAMIPSYSGDTVTLFTLKSGGTSGTTTNIIALNYTGDSLTSKVLKASDGTTVLNTYTFSYSGSTLVSKVLT